ncbi:hypothetical protein [Aristophania vespae]|uniref:hypothetical protein n=1 Tax=Aristophania vespae TaxID=2697033 RepID=UPI002351A2A6|nr:hypothetical protein [Aristophania vespae]
MKEGLSTARHTGPEFLNVPMRRCTSPGKKHAGSAPCSSPEREHESGVMCLSWGKHKASIMRLLWTMHFILEEHESSIMHRATPHNEKDHDWLGGFYGRSSLVGKVML